MNDTLKLIVCKIFFRPSHKKSKITSIVYLFQLTYTNEVGAWKMLMKRETGSAVGSEIGVALDALS